MLKTISCLLERQQIWRITNQNQKVLFLLHAVLDKDIMLVITAKFYSIRTKNNNQSYSKWDMYFYTCVYIHTYIDTYIPDWSSS